MLHVYIFIKNRNIFASIIFTIYALYAPTLNDWNTLRAIEAMMLRKYFVKIWKNSTLTHIAP